jgi:hypothetical protein
MTIRMLFFAGTVATLCSCAPTLPPFLVAETAEVLPEKGVALSAGGGAALLTTDFRTAGGCCAGAETRVRVGVGNHQELSLTNAWSATGGVWNLSSRVGYKRQLARWAAIEAGASFVLHHFTRQAMGGLGLDVNAVLSAPASGRWRRVQPYGGLRTATVVPLASDVFSGPGLVGALSIPAGLAWRTSRATRFFLEGGALATYTWYRANDAVFSYPLGGAYGALDFEVTLR